MPRLVEKVWGQKSRCLIGANDFEVDIKDTIVDIDRVSMTTFVPLKTL